MNIAVDAFPLTAKSASGIPNYTKNILDNLANIDKQNDYFLYCKNPIAFVPARNGHMRTSPSATESSTSYGNTVWLFTQGIRLMKKDRIDIFWGTRHMLPPYLPKGIRNVLTVHDLVWHYFPETMDRYNLLVMELFAGRSIRAADHIIAVSEATARAIVDVMGVGREKISVIYHGAGSYVPLDRKSSAEYISNKYKTRHDYVLTVSTVEPRKNLKTLLAVFSHFGKGGGPQLLIAGASGWMTSAIHTEYRRLGLSEKEVKFLGYVPDEDMNKLYSGARLFLFPSVYEGFGIPPLESMAAGTPVIASNSSSLPEVVGSAGILLDPYDVEAWRASVAMVLSEKSLQEKLTADGVERSRHFSWETAARQTLEVFEKLA
jgi:glycosyltransferase involved in cell wall biosynthesis